MKDVLVLGEHHFTVDADQFDWLTESVFRALVRNCDIDFDITLSALALFDAHDC